VTETINMSDAESREVSQENEVIETEATEQLDLPAGEQAEGSTQESTEETFEPIDLNDLVSETKAEDDSTKKQLDNAHAKARVYRNKLKQLEDQVSKGEIHSEYAFKGEDVGQEPTLDSFQSRLYDDFEGSTELMLAHFNEARRIYDSKTQGVSTQREQHLEQVKQSIKLEQEAADRFDTQTESFKKYVPDIDDSLAKAEKLLGEADFNAIRGVVGDNAPLVLGVIGENKDVQLALQEAAATGNQAHLIKYLTRLEDRVSNNLPRKTVSKAGSESPLSGSVSKNIDYDAEIARISSDPSIKAMDRVNQIKELRRQKNS